MPKTRTDLTEDSLIDLKYITNDSGFTAKYFYSLMKRGEFPAPIKLGRSSRWLLRDYSEWKAKYIKRRYVSERLK
ncbi:helix-turn-helix transcriptional regulator [Citrobacter freundii]|uniref:helix-turn-helix transcriptional regulator n=1 Tax=Citrobacter freundii TaxID=546 RepID=UPI001FFE1291|nr:AlpA family phage regulatory protein [Citrobacter freundii]